MRVSISGELFNSCTFPSIYQLSENIYLKSNSILSLIVLFICTEEPYTVFDTESLEIPLRTIDMRTFGRMKCKQNILYVDARTC